MKSFRAQFVLCFYGNVRFLWEVERFLGLKSFGAPGRYHLESLKEFEGFSVHV